jgi:hypothetical protein
MVVSVFKWLEFTLMASFLYVGPSQFTSYSSAPAKEQNGVHPFHVSTTEINFNATDKTLEITCKIFTDDFENILRKNYKTKVDLSDAKMKEAMDKLVSDYVKKNLQLKVDGKAIALSYLGFEMDGAAVNTYLQGEGITAVKKIEAVNSLMYDMFDDQISIMHVTVSGKRKSTKLDYPNTAAAFEY